MSINGHSMSRAGDLSGNINNANNGTKMCNLNVSRRFVITLEGSTLYLDACELFRWQIFDVKWVN